MTPDEEPSGAPAWIAWVVVGAALLGTFLLGAFLLARPPGPAEDRAEQAAEQADSGSDEGTSGEESGDSGSDDAEEGSGEQPTAEPSAIASLATVEVPGSAPPNNDVDGSQVTFTGTNLIDGDPTTAWRLAGDRTGTTVTLRFPSPIQVSQVGLVNGWAKVSTSSSGAEYDWYQSNRRVVSADWLINGQTFTQTFSDSMEPQTMEVTPAETTDVQLTITAVSGPGSVNPRDFTALSEIVVAGVAD